MGLVSSHNEIERVLGGVVHNENGEGAAGRCTAPGAGGLRCAGRRPCGADGPHRAQHGAGEHIVYQSRIVANTSLHVE